MGTMAAMGMGGALTPSAAARARRARVRATKVAALGACLRALKLRDASRRATLAFALGVFPMWRRTEGNPRGYVPPKKKKTKAKPAKLHWDTVGNVEGTIWEGAGSLDTRTLAFLFGDLKEMFEKKPAAKGGKGGAGGAGGAAKKKKKPKKVEITFIEDDDGNRTQNMGIAVSRFKNFGFDRMADAVTRMDLSEVPDPGAAIEIMTSPLCLPKGGDAANALKYDKPEGLGLNERYLWHMCRVPNLLGRLRSMQAKASFAAGYEDVERDVDVLDRACKEVTAGERLRRLLTRYVLPFGNALNEGTKLAGAKGVKLTVINKLAITKAANNPRMTMLDYLVERIDAHEPELLGLAADFGALRDAARLQDENLRGGLKRLTANVALVKTALEKAAAESDDVFLDAMEQFGMDAGGKLAALQAREAAARADFATTAKYIGEDPSKMKPDTLFSLVKAFVHTFNEAAMKYRERKAKAEERARIEARKAANARAKPSRPAGRKPKTGGGAAAS